MYFITTQPGEVALEIARRSGSFLAIFSQHKIIDESVKKLFQ